MEDSLEVLPQEADSLGPESDLEEAGCMSYVAVSHQMAIQALWLHFRRAVTSSIFINSLCNKHSKLCLVFLIILKFPCWIMKINPGFEWLLGCCFCIVQISITLPVREKKMNAKSRWWDKKESKLWASKSLLWNSTVKLWDNESCYEIVNHYYEIKLR